MKKNIFVAFLLLATISLVGAGCNKKTTQNQQSSNIAAEEKLTPEEKNIKSNQEVTRDGYINVSPKEAKRLMEENESLVIIDVSPVYAKGHLPGAVNYYVGDGSLDEAIPALDKTKD